MNGAAGDREGVARSQPPLAGAVRGFRFPAFERARLVGGLELYLARWPYYPLVSLELLLPAGGQYDPGGAAGLASLHGALLDEGTEERSALEIASTVERLGAYLGTGADWDVAYVGATVLPVHLEAGLELVAEIARRPSFPDAEVARTRRHRLAEILRRKGQPASLAERSFARLVFAGTPYARPLIGTEESVRALERRHCTDFYRRHMGAEGAALIAVGDLDPRDLVPRLEELFGDWASGPKAPRPRIEPPALEATEVCLVDRPGSAQTQLQLGHHGLDRDHPDHPQVLLMNAILGGKFTSRLNLSLREKLGVTYGAYSQFVYRQGRGPFAIRLAVATEAAGTAVREIVAQMRRLRHELVTEEELRETQDFLVGAFPTTLQTVSDLAKRLEILAVHGLPDDYYASYPAVLREVTPEDVRRAAQRWLHPDRLAVVAVGPADELAGQLDGLGPLTVRTP